MKITKGANGETKTDNLMAVRYGDLIVPSEAEIKDAHRQIERRKLLSTSRSIE